MSSYTYKQILTKAKAIKKEMESKGQLETSPKWSYYIGSSILNPDKNIGKISFDNASDPTGTKINQTIQKSDYVTLTKNIVTFVGNNKKLPNYATYKKDKIERDLYAYMLAKVLVFYDENKRLPNTVGVNYEVLKAKAQTNQKKTTNKQKSTSKTASKCSNPYKSSPHYLTEGCNRLGQCTAYFCAPHCIHQVLKKFGVTDISESQLASWAGTTVSGTDHGGIETAIAKAAKKKDMKLKVEWHYMSDFGKTTSEQFKALAKKACQSNIGIFFHIGYQGSGKSANGQVFGHYEGLDTFNIVTKQVRALNSLGNKCGSGYCGHTQWRDYGLEKHYINNKVGVKSVCVITKK